MINIMYVVPQLQKGGGEKQFFLLLSRLDRKRYHPIVVNLTSTGGYYQDQLKALDVLIEVVTGNHLEKLFKLYRLMTTHRPQLVHTWLNNEWGRLAAIGYRLFTRNACGVVCSERDDMYESSRRFRKLFIIISRLLSFFTDRVVFNSLIPMERFNRGFYRKNCVQFIGNGVELAPDLPIENLLRTRAIEPIKCAMVARFVDQKWHDLVIEALAGWQHAYRMKIVFVGDGPLRERLERTVADNGLDGVVEFAGKMIDVSPVLRNVDVGMLISKTEGFSNAVLEYMEHSLPLILTDAGANRLCLNGNGFMVGDVSELRHAWQTYLDHPDLLTTHGKASRHLVQAFDIGSITKEYEKIYEAALASRRIDATS